MAQPLVTVESDKNAPAFYKKLSLKLCAAMEILGSSTDITSLTRERGIMNEVASTLFHQPGISYCVFGSFIEGSIVPGKSALASDIDSVFVINALPVITDCADASVDKCLLMIQDENTPPGYAKLQLVKNGNPLFGDEPDEIISSVLPPGETWNACIDKSNRVVCQFNPSDDSDSGLGLKRHGAALSKERFGRVAACDWVFSFRCHRLPDSVADWLQRDKPHSWPPPGIVEECQEFGCLFVPVGHPNSVEQHLLWRISPSHQERLLVSKFNSVQLKCYILLKMIKQDIISHFLREESLSSYHCKTCMLYMIENTPSSFWRPENLLVCLASCIKTLQVWVENGICPNYFIPAENMFDRRVHGVLRRNLSLVLRKLVDADAKYICCMPNSPFKIFFNGFICMDSEYLINKLIREKKTLLKLEYTCGIISLVLDRTRSLLRQSCNKDIGISMLGLYKAVCDLKGTTKVLGRSEEETQNATNIILPYIELSLIPSIIAFSVQIGCDAEKIWGISLSSAKWNELGAVSDVFTSKLKQASLMHTFGYYQTSLDILSTLKTRAIFSVCCCMPEEPFFPDRSVLSQTLNKMTDISYKELLLNHFVPCIVYLPNELQITPTALCYEMIRSERTSPGSRHAWYDFWYDWAVIDGQFLICFLSYLNHSRLNMNIEAKTDITNMLSVINIKRISHMESCLNLLGWVYREQELYDRAAECFHKSLQIKRHHNAAFWHYCMMVFEIYFKKIHSSLKA